MINIKKVFSRAPFRETFPSTKELAAFTGSLRKDPRFRVTVAGRSALGKPIHHVRFGNGKLKVLFVGYPHPNEPVGGLTVMTLLTLLKQGCPELEGQGIEWHFVPCAAPDGAALTEGWTLRPFSFRRFMEYYFRKDPCHDIESAFPIKYRTLNFSKPVPETRALMKVLRAARPDLYYSLHNASQEEAFFLVGRDLGGKYYARFRELLRGLGIPLSRAPLPLAVKACSRGVYSEILIRAEYDSLKRSVKDPAAYIKSGATPVEYLRGYNKDAFSFLCEFPHVKRRRADGKRPSGVNRRLQLRRSAADNLLLTRGLVEEWRKVKGAVNRRSPFYTQVAARMPGREAALKAAGLNKSAPAGAPGGRRALRSEVSEENLNAYYALCWNWQFVRLLEDSRQAPAVKAARARLKRLLLKFYGALERRGAFLGLAPIPAARLVKAQLGSGLIVINYLLENGS